MFVCVMCCVRMCGGGPRVTRLTGRGGVLILPVCVETLFNIEIWTPELDTGSGRGTHITLMPGVRVFVFLYVFAFSDRPCNAKSLLAV